MAAALFAYVYKTATEFETHFHRMRERAELLVHDFDTLHSNISELRKKSEAKASYQDAEQLLSGTTSKLMLRGKRAALEPINAGIKVELQ